MTNVFLDSRYFRIWIVAFMYPEVFNLNFIRKHHYGQPVACVIKQLMPENNTRGELGNGPFTNLVIERI